MGKASGKKKQTQETISSENNQGKAWTATAGSYGIMSKMAVHIFLIAVVGLIAYSNTFEVPFVFDDANSIVKNPVITSLDNFLSSSEGYTYSPGRVVGYFSFALNYRFGELEVAGYHAVNLAIHIINALLVYFLVSLTFRTPYFRAWRIGQSAKSREHSGKYVIDSSYALSPAPYAQLIALFSALLFVSHPIQTQAVTYIVQRITSLATMFYLLSLVFYIRGRLASRLAGRLAGYVFSLASAVLAMRTKEITFTLPLVIILYEVFFFKAALKKRLLFLAPVLLALIIILISVINSDRSLGELLSELDEKTRAQAIGSRWVYFVTEIRVITTYIRLIFFPINQNLAYDYPVYRSILSLEVFPSFIFILSILGVAAYLFYRSQIASLSSRVSDTQPQVAPLMSRLVAFGIFWFFITLSIESSFIPIADVIVEHRVYLPSVGIFIAVAAGMTAVANYFSSKTTAVTAILAIIIIVFSAATYMRNNVWRSARELWEDTALKSPETIRPFYNLGNEYLKQQQYDKAIEMYQRALQIKPKEFVVSDAYLGSYNNLGIAYCSIGQYETAIELFNQFIKQNPGYIEAYNNLGGVYINSGKYLEAIGPLQTVIKNKPDNVIAHYNLALAYWSIKDINNAEKEYAILERLSPIKAAELLKQMQPAR